MVFLISLIFSGELVFQKATTHNLNPVVVSAFSINKNDDVCIVSNRLSLLFGKIDALSHVNFPISKSHKIIWVESLKSFVLSDYQNNLVSFWDKNGSLLGKRNIYPEKYRDYLFLPENKVIRVKEDLNGPYTIQFLCEEKPVFSFNDNDNSRLREGTIVKRLNEPYSIWGNCESHICFYYSKLNYLTLISVHSQNEITQLPIEEDANIECILFSDDQTILTCSPHGRYQKKVTLFDLTKGVSHSGLLFDYPKAISNGKLYLVDKNIVEVYNYKVSYD